MTDPTDAELRALCEAAMERFRHGDSPLLEFYVAARTALPRLLDERDGLVKQLHAFKVEYQDEDGIADLMDILSAARADWRTVAEHLGGIAFQHTSAERDAADEDEGDLSGAYDVVIGIARVALAIAERHANKEGGDPNSGRRPSVSATSADNAKPSPDVTGERAHWPEPDCGPNGPHDDGDDSTFASPALPPVAGMETSEEEWAQWIYDQEREDSHHAIMKDSPLHRAGRDRDRLIAALAEARAGLEQEKRLRDLADACVDSLSRELAKRIAEARADAKKAREEERAAISEWLCEQGQTGSNFAIAIRARTDGDEA